MSETIDEFPIRLSRASDLETRGVNPYPPEAFISSHTTTQLVYEFSNLRGSTVKLAGRLTSKRDHGKLIFGSIDDSVGRIQTVITKDKMPEDFQLIKANYDAGDFVGVQGILEATNRGVPSIWAEEVTMLAKALRSAPFRITDPEILQRQRYLDTLIDPDAKKRFITRSAVVQGMRDYFINEMGCLEVETPVMDSIYGGAQAKPFETRHEALDQNMFLRISPELYLKRMTLSYLQGVFEFSRNFRNEGMDRTHNPEFTTVELYKPFWDYEMMMTATENMMSGIAQKIHGTTKVPYNLPLGEGQEKEVVIDYTPPWKRLSVYDGIQQKLGVDPQSISDSELRTLANEWGISGHSRGDTLLGLFEAVWDNDLIQPTFVKDYPTSTSALTKRHRLNPDLTERFEMYAGGMELMNCYTELNDPRDQRMRFEAEQKKALAGDKEAMPFDEDFVLAQEYGMPPQSGVGISVDRWTMLLTNTNHIRQVIYFPALRNLKK